jgi:hypothetical protein
LIAEKICGRKLPLPIRRGEGRGEGHNQSLAKFFPLC